jgi:phosphate transport system protein
MHILGSFDEALGSLRNNVLMMASLTERNLERAFRGLFERDEELCNLVIADDEEIELLLRFQPVAIDLRSIIAAMKLGANLERIADQATGIARRARRLNQQPLLAESRLIERMTEDVTAMLKDSLRAFTDGDLELAAGIKPRDRQLDQANAEINQVLTELAQKQPANITSYLDLIFIARNIERIGDHATNIAEDAVYVKAAQDVRHVKAEAAS